MNNQINTSGGASIQNDVNITDGRFVGRDSIEAQQAQQGGDGSVNIQAHSLIFQSGLSVRDVREVALELFEQNFQKLSEKATETATQRAREITDKFLEKLQEQNPQGLQQAEEPNFQYALLTAQREYAKVGDEELANLLVDILVDRTKETTRSLASIVLDESLNVVPKLTSDQIAAITLIFMLRYTKWTDVNSLPALVNSASKKTSRLIPLLPQRYSAYQHLEFSRCCNIQINEQSIAAIFRTAYSGLFCRGFTLESLLEIIPNVENLDGLIMQCFHDKTLLQLNAIDSSIFQNLATEKGLAPDLVAKLIELQNNNLMSPTEIKNILDKLNPNITELIETWDLSILKQITLTSVGIAIAHANIRRLDGENSPLSVWI